MKNVKKGFTLIELLVVVAIIGVLASVVLASLNSARAKGNDAAAKSSLANIRSQAELVYDMNGCYSSSTTSVVACAAAAVASAACPALGGTGATAGFLFAEPTINAQVTAAKNAGLFSACSTSANQAAWAVAVALRSNTTKGWCVDSTGKSKEITENTGTPVAFTASTILAEVNASGACVE